MHPPEPTDPVLCPDVEALLREALDCPTNPVPRAILADWLDENGEPERAELIRLHDALAHSPPDSAERDALSAREQQLRETIENDWLRPLGGPGCEWAFDAGLVVRGSLEVRTFLARWEEIHARTWAREFDLFAATERDSTVNVAALAACPGLSRVRRLSLAGQYLNPGELAPLVTGSVLASVRLLDLSDNALGAEGAEALGRCPGLARLQELRLEGNLLGDAGLAALLAPGGLRELIALGLARNSLTDGGLAALAGPRLPALKALDLGHNALTGRAVQVLGAGGVLTGLTALDVRENFLGDGALGLLAVFYPPGSTVAIGVVGNPISREAFLSCAPYLAGLAGCPPRSN
jgi:uncharacterized protein (TIGR02996 family)